MGNFVIVYPQRERLKHVAVERMGYEIEERKFGNNMVRLRSRCGSSATYRPHAAGRHSLIPGDESVSAASATHQKSVANRLADIKLAHTFEREHGLGGGISPPVGESEFDLGNLHLDVGVAMWPARKQLGVVSVLFDKRTATTTSIDRRRHRTRHVWRSPTSRITTPALIHGPTSYTAIRCLATSSNPTI